MNTKVFIEQFDQLVNRIHRYQDTHDSMVAIKDDIYEFLNQNYEVYLNANLEERKEIRELVKQHHTGSESPNLLVLFLIGYVQVAAKQIKLTGDKTCLLRGLGVSSIENSLRDQRDYTFTLSYLYVMAEISSKELSSAGTISMSELVNNIPEIAHHTYYDWLKYR
jgi:hypothetical protein